MRIPNIHNSVGDFYFFRFFFDAKDKARGCIDVPRHQRESAKRYICSVSVHWLGASFASSRGDAFVLTESVFAPCGRLGVPGVFPLSGASTWIVSFSSSYFYFRFSFFFSDLIFGILIFSLCPSRHVYMLLFYE